MNNEAARILLAEWQGWKNIYGKTRRRATWLPPGKSEDEDFWCQKFVPNPHLDANDCNTLITFLKSNGWTTNVNHSCEDAVKVWRFKNPDTKEYIWQGDNWLHGVCELAVKIREREIKDD